MKVRRSVRLVNKFARGYQMLTASLINFRKLTLYVLKVFKLRVALGHK